MTLWRHFAALRRCYVYFWAEIPASSTQTEFFFIRNFRIYLLNVANESKLYIIFTDFELGFVITTLNETWYEAVHAGKSTSDVQLSRDCDVGVVCETQIIYTVNQKTSKCFCHIFHKTQSILIKFHWYTLSWINLWYSSLDVFQLTWMMRRITLWKLKFGFLWTF